MSDADFKNLSTKNKEQVESIAAGFVPFATEGEYESLGVAYAVAHFAPFVGRGQRGPFTECVLGLSRKGKSPTAAAAMSEEDSSWDAERHHPNRMLTEDAERCCRLLKASAVKTRGGGMSARDYQADRSRAEALQRDGR